MSNLVPNKFSSIFTERNISNSKSIEIKIKFIILNNFEHEGAFYKIFAEWRAS